MGNDGERGVHWPLVGQLPGFLRDPLATMRRSLTRGNASTINLGFAQVLLLHHPAAADHVLRKHQRNYTKGGPYWDSVRSLLGKGLPTAEGDVWLRHRRLMQPQFLRRRLQALAPLVVDAITRSTRWPDVTDEWTTIDIGDRMPHLTMNVVSAAMFGHRISHSASHLLEREFNFTIGHMFRAMVAQVLPSFIPVPGRRRYHRAISEVQRVLASAIETRRRDPQDSSDLLAGLLAATDDETGQGLSNAELLDEVLSLFLAGYETTSSALAWALHFLCEHPEHLARVRQQADEVLGGRRPTFEDLPALNYSRWVIQEALRLNPPAWWLPRVARCSDEIAGHRVAAGSMVAPVIYTIHRNQEFWPNPEQFDPTRFEPSEVATRHPLAWMPFGAGPRKCIGQELSLMESTLTLAMLSQRFEIESVGHRTRASLSTVIRPSGGVRARVRRRRGIRPAIVPAQRPHASDSDLFVL